MDARSVLRSINKAWRVAAAMNLGETFSNPGSLKVSAAFRDLCLSPEVKYEEIYAKGLELLQYNFMLSDYSYFQFSWLGNESVRYAFYPNPFAPAASSANSHARVRELAEAGLLTHEEYLSLLSDHLVANRDPPIRFEHSQRDYRAFHHPCAHLHIGHPPRGRWCVARSLTPLAFTMLILKHQYPQEWQSVGADVRDATGNSLEGALLKERALSPELPEEFISVLEKRSFRFE